MMCEKIEENWRKFREWIPTAFISFGALFTLYGVSEKSSFCMLLGTFFLGWGFYLKVNRVPKQKLSEYGHFMLGIAALITLPQAPEMLKHVLKIEESIKELSDGIRYMNSIRAEMVASFVEPKAKSIAEAIENSPKQTEKIIKDLIQKPNACLSKEIPFNSTFLSLENKKSFSPMVYLTKENADKIIRKLAKEEIAGDRVESLLQEHLEVWRPQYEKCRKDQLK